MYQMKDGDDYEIQTIQALQANERFKKRLIWGNVIFFLVMLTFMIMMDSDYEFDGLWSYNEPVNQSVASLEKMCDEHVQMACFRLGLYYQSGQEVAKSLSKAEEYFRKGCRLDHGPSCVNLGWLTEEGNTEADYKMAMQYYSKACNNGDEYGYGCFNKGLMYFNGHGVEKDPQAALSFYTYSCKQTHSCYDLGSVYTVGKNTPKYYRNPDTLEQRLFRQARRYCDNNVNYCYMVGAFYKDGVYVDRNLPRAIRFAKLSCENEYLKRSSPQGWILLGHIYKKGGLGVETDLKQAKAYFQKACDASFAEGCKEVGMLYDKDARVHDHVLIEDDLGQASEFYGKGCKEGDGFSCYRYSELTRLSLDNQEIDESSKAFEYYEKACNQDIQGACEYLMHWYQNKADEEQVDFLKHKICLIQLRTDCNSESAVSL